MITYVTVRIEGMSCHSCEIRVETALKSVPGIRSVTVDATKGEARIAFDDEVTSLDTIRGKMRGVGYEVPDQDDAKSSPTLFVSGRRGHRGPRTRLARMTPAEHRQIPSPPSGDTDPRVLARDPVCGMTVD